MTQQRRGLLKEDYIIALDELAVTLAASATQTSNARELPHPPNHILVIEARVTFNGGATQGAQITIETSMDNTNWDTELDTSRVGTIAVAAGQAAQKTFVFDAIHSRFYRVKAENLDGSVSLTVDHVKVYESPYVNYWGAF